MVVVDVFVVVVDDEVVDLIVVVGVVVEVEVELVVGLVVEGMVEGVVGDFVVVKTISASVVPGLGLGLGPAEVLSVLIKPCDSVVSLSLSSLFSSSSDRKRSICG